MTIDMDLLKEISDLSKQGIFIEYYIVDQLDNCSKEMVDKGIIPRYTFTVTAKKDCIHYPTKETDCSADRLEDAIEEVFNTINKWVE